MAFTPAAMFTRLAKQLIVFWNDTKVRGVAWGPCCVGRCWNMGCVPERLPPMRVWPVNSEEGR